MTIKRTALASVASLLLVSCGDASDHDHDHEGESAVERPSDAPAIGSGESLLELTCADFLATALVAIDTDAGDEALAAQDEIANGLVWLHGYLFAKDDGDIPPLSQDWMQATGERVYATCEEAEDPAKVNLFEVSIDEDA